MQWDDSPNAGFSTPEATPWLPLAADYRTRNVAAQESDPASMLNFYRSLAALRRTEPALNRGAYEEVYLGLPDVLAYLRTWPGSDGFLILLNFSSDAHTIDLAVLGMDGAKLVFSTYPGRGVTGVMPTLTLAPDSGVIYRLVQDD